MVTFISSLTTSPAQPSHVLFATRNAVIARSRACSSSVSVRYSRTLSSNVASQAAGNASPPERRDHLRKGKNMVPSKSNRLNHQGSPRAGGFVRERFLSLPSAPQPAAQPLHPAQPLLTQPNRVPQLAQLGKLAHPADRLRRLC